MHEESGDGPEMDPTSVEAVRSSATANGLGSSKPSEIVPERVRASRVVGLVVVEGDQCLLEDLEIEEEGRASVMLGRRRWPLQDRQVDGRQRL